jgi:hypothetical protein
MRARPLRFDGRVQSFNKLQASKRPGREGVRNDPRASMRPGCEGSGMLPSRNWFTQNTKRRGLRAVLPSPRPAVQGARLAQVHDFKQPRNINDFSVRERSRRFWRRRTARAAAAYLRFAQITTAPRSIGAKVLPRLSTASSMRAGMSVSSLAADGRVEGENALDRRKLGRGRVKIRHSRLHASATSETRASGGCGQIENALL